MPVKMLISDVNHVHGNTCLEKAQLECPSLEGEVRLETLASSIVYALANKFDIISRSTTGLNDARNENEGDTAYEGTEITGEFSDEFSYEFDADRIGRVGIVHAHGSNSHILLTDPSRLDIIMAVGAGDGEENNNCSYGPGLEIFNDDETSESYTTARIAGIIAQLMTDHPSWTFWDARFALRQTASLYNTGWIQDGGFGASDKVAADLVETIPPFSPTRTSEISTRGVLTFGFIKSPQSNFSKTFVSIHKRKPARDYIPRKSEIIYSDVWEEFEYVHLLSGTYYFVYHTLTSEYSLAESYDIVSINISPCRHGVTVLQTYSNPSRI